MINAIADIECFRCGQAIGRYEESAMAFLPGWGVNSKIFIAPVHAAFCRAKESEGPIRIKSIDEISNDEWVVLNAQGESSTEFARVEPIIDTRWLILDYRRLYDLAADIAAFHAGGLKLESAIARVAADEHWRQRHQ